MSDVSITTLYGNLYGNRHYTEYPPFICMQVSTSLNISDELIIANC